MSKKEISPVKTTNEGRRQFLGDVTTGLAAVGAACAAAPFVKSLKPAANVVAEKTTDVDLSDVEEGDFKVILWQGKPVFIRRRSAEEVAALRAEKSADLMDPATDETRVQRPEWLVSMAVCTHLGCVPMAGGEYGGWLCPCHGSQFDASGRVRKGPAKSNLEVPPYTFLDDTTIRIG